MIADIFDFLFHTDRYLVDILNNYGRLSFLILFVILFFESGVILTAFLPGNVLLFGAGMIAAQGTTNPLMLFLVFVLAGWTGNLFNYFIGKSLGKKLLKDPSKYWLKQDQLDRTQGFYKKHGNKAVFFCRFVPYLHILVPFIAGTVLMDRKVFIFNTFSAVLIWVILFFFAGYFLGNIPWVARNFNGIMLGIVLVGLMPVFIVGIKNFFDKK